MRARKNDQIWREGGSGSPGLHSQVPEREGAVYSLGSDAGIPLR